jgi:hypothetical protein
MDKGYEGRAWDNLSEALRPLRQEYHEQIRTIARDVTSEVATAREEGRYNVVLEDLLHEWVDSHEWVIYTYKAQLVSLISDADPEAMGWEVSGEWGHPSLKHEVRAFECIKHDVSVYLLACTEPCHAPERHMDSDDSCSTCDDQGEVFAFYGPTGDLVQRVPVYND